MLAGDAASTWAEAMAQVFSTLGLESCAEVGTPAWWNDEELKALSARVVRAAPDDGQANKMRAVVLSGLSRGTWEAGPRSAAELREAATHYDRTAALVCPTESGDKYETKAMLAAHAARCRRRAEAM